MTTHTHRLANAPVDLGGGVTIPQLGYGVWQVPDEDAERLVAHAIAAGYRHVDTARVYENEEGVGRGVRSSGVPREEVFVTTKLWNSSQGHEPTLRAFDRSLERLGMDYVDLYLIHWPAPLTRGEDYLGSWQAFIELQDDGRVRAIGVSNFHPEHLERAAEVSGVMPSINQVELHPYFQQRDLRAFHRTNRIATEAWSPLGQGGELLADPAVAGIAAAHGVTAAQVVLRWHLQLGNVVIPKSATPARIVENIDLDRFELSADDMQAIEQLDRGAAGRIGPDPMMTRF